MGAVASVWESFSYLNAFKCGLRSFNAKAMNNLFITPTIFTLVVGLCYWRHIVEFTSYIPLNSPDGLSIVQADSNRTQINVSFLVCVAKGRVLNCFFFFAFFLFPSFETHIYEISNGKYMALLYLNPKFPIKSDAFNFINRFLLIFALVQSDVFISLQKKT